MKTTLKTLAFLTFISANALAQLPSNGLVAYYPFTNNTNDSIGTNDGNIFGTVVPTVDRFGRANRAYNFNGINGYVQMTDPLIPTNMIAGLSISLWFRAGQEKDTIKRQFLLSKYDGNGVTIELTPEPGIVGNGKLKTGLRYNGGTKPETNVFSKTRMDDSLWHNVVMTWKKDTLKQFIDGKLIGYQTSANINFDPANEVVRIGCFEDAANKKVMFYRGVIDDIAIYNRPLTTNEVKQIAGMTSSVLNVSKPKVDIFPIPVNDLLTIVAEGFKMARIYDLTGKLLLESTNPKIDLASLTNGLYIAKVETRQGIVTEKISKY